MAGIDTLKLDKEQLYSALSNFWNKYVQRDNLGKFWEGVSQTLDNEYLQIFQANFSKSVFNVPVEWHYQWNLLTLVKEPEVVEIHDHFFLELTAGGGETIIALPGATAPVKITVFVNGIFLSDNTVTPGTNWRFLSGTNEVEFLSALDAGDEVFITWIEEGDSFDRHENLVFEEFLTGPKSSWTDAAGDAFDPAFTGSYDSGSTTDPIEVLVNGVKQPPSSYTETSDTVLDTSFTLDVGDHILLRWRRVEAAAELHSHLRFTKKIAVPSDTVNLPFSITTVPRGEFVYINGVMQFRDVNYTAFVDRIVFDAILDIDDVFEIEFYGDAFLFQYEIDPAIIRIPVLQDGIDEEAVNGPTFVIREGVDFTIFQSAVTGKKFISSNTDIEGELWAPDLFVDEQAVRKNFGDPIGFVRDNSEQYLLATQALWKAFWEGPDVTVISDALKAIVSLPIVTNGGTVRKVDTTSDPQTVEMANGDVFEIPAGFSIIVSPGEELDVLATLTDGIDVLDLVNDPDWFTRVKDLSSILDERFIPFGDGIPGFFNEPDTFFDDGGVFDQIDDPTDVNEQIFEVIKHFTFMVIFDPLVLNAVALGLSDTSSAEDQEQILTEMAAFLNNIRPAYTQFLLIGESEFTDEYDFDITDDFALLKDFIPTDALCAYDDGGFFDATGPFNSSIATAGQTVFTLNPAFPYTVGGGLLKVFVDQVLQTITTDYLETNGLTVTFVTPLAGGEEVIIYEDDAAIDTFDNRCMRDEVSLVLA